jgi:hypothetical protein
MWYVSNTRRLKSTFSEVTITSFTQTRHLMHSSMAIYLSIFKLPTWGHRPNYQVTGDWSRAWNEWEAEVVKRARWEGDTAILDPKHSHCRTTHHHAITSLSASHTNTPDKCIWVTYKPMPDKDEKNNEIKYRMTLDHSSVSDPFLELQTSILTELVVRRIHRRCSMISKKLTHDTWIS